MTTYAAFALVTRRCAIPPVAHRTFRQPNGLTIADQTVLLREAGFSGAATVRQRGDGTVLVAVR